MKGNKGPIKMILTGDKMVDTVDCQFTCDAEAIKYSTGWSKSEVVTKRKTIAPMIKKITNFILEVFMSYKV